MFFSQIIRRSFCKKLVFEISGRSRHDGEQDGWGDVEDDQERQGDGDRDRRGGQRGGRDGATSRERCDSKRVDSTRLLAGHILRSSRDICTGPPEPTASPMANQNEP